MPDFETYTRAALEQEVNTPSGPGLAALAQEEIDIRDTLAPYADYLRDCANDLESRLANGGRKGFDRPVETPPNP